METLIIFLKKLCKKLNNVLENTHLFYFTYLKKENKLYKFYI